MSTTSDVQIDFAPGLENAFFAEIAEQSRSTPQIEGDIPDYLRGTYYLNGPAKFNFGEDFRYRHWLDGDGMVCALHFAADGVYFDCKYVRSRKFVREREDVGGPVYRTFGTAFPGDRLKRGIGTESPYNVSVFTWRDKLLAFGEQSLPIELDPSTLETLTPGKTFDFDGELNDAAPFSAHPKIDSRTGELLNFGIFFAPQQPLLVYYRLDGNGKLACRSRVPIDLTSSVHDFAASDNYAVFYLTPYVLDPSGLTERGLATIDALTWEPQRGSQLLVLCRETGKEVARIPIEGRYCLHTINAFEQNGQLVLDVIEFDRPVYDQYQDVPDLFTDVPYGLPARFILDVENNQVVSKETIRYRGAPDFPAIDPSLDARPYNDIWMLGISSAGQKGRKFFDRLVHLKWSEPTNSDQWHCGPGQYLGGEPVFVANPAEPNGGVIICHVFNAEGPGSQFALFDAANVASGPFASITLPAPIHLAFHASFAPDGMRENLDKRGR